MDEIKHKYEIIPIIFVAINSIFSGIGFLNILNFNGIDFVGDFIIGFIWIFLSLIFQLNLLFLYENLKSREKK